MKAISKDIHHTVGGHHFRPILDSDPTNQILVLKMSTLAAMRAEVVIMSRRASESALIQISPATVPTTQKRFSKLSLRSTSIGMSDQCCNWLPFRHSNGNDVSGHYFCHYFPVFFLVFPPLSTFLIEGVLE